MQKEKTKTIVKTSVFKTQKHFQKAIYVLATAFISSTAQAAISLNSSNMDLNCPFSGFYTGISLGESSTLGRAHLNRSANVSAPLLGISFDAQRLGKESLKKSSFVGAAFAGFGCTWDPIYLGLEAFAKGANGKTKLRDKTTLTTNLAGTLLNLNIVNHTVAKLRTVEFGADFRPGILVAASSLLYGKIGAAFNKISLKSSNNFNNGRSLNSFEFPFNHSKNKHVAALRLGAGLEQLICNNWALRADYTFTNYRKISLHNSGSFNIFNPLGIATIGTVSNSTEAKLYNHAVMFGVSYYW